MNINGYFYGIRSWESGLWNMLYFKLGLKIPGTLKKLSLIFKFAAINSCLPILYTSAVRRYPAAPS